MGPAKDTTPISSEIIYEFLTDDLVSRTEFGCKRDETRTAFHVDCVEILVVYYVVHTVYVGICCSCLRAI